MIVKKSKGVVNPIAKAGTELTYLSRGKEVGVHFVTIEGVANKLTTNAKKVFYITKGRGVVRYNGKEKKLSKAYVLILEAGTQYDFEGKFTAVAFKF